jgi:hypothetical protein
MNVDNIKVIPPDISDSILSGTDAFAGICCGVFLSAEQMIHRKTFMKNKCPSCPFFTEKRVISFWGLSRYNSLLTFFMCYLLTGVRKKMRITS